MAGKRRKLISIGDAADELGVSVPTLRKWVDTGEIKAIRLPSGYRRFEPAEVDRKRREMGFTNGEPSPTGAHG